MNRLDTKWRDWGRKKMRGECQDFFQNGWKSLRDNGIFFCTAKVQGAEKGAEAECRRGAASALPGRRLRGSGKGQFQEIGFSHGQPMALKSVTFRVATFAPVRTASAAMRPSTRLGLP